MTDENRPQEGDTSEGLPSGEEQAITRRRFVAAGAAIGAAVVWSSPFPFADKAIGQLLPVDDALGATGPTGPTGPGPPGPTPGHSVAQLHLHRRLKIGRKGSFFVTVECVGDATLSGSLLLQATTGRTKGAREQAARKINLARASFQIPAGASKRVKVTLNAKARRLLRQRRALAATLTARSSGNPDVVRHVRLLSSLP